MGVWVSLIRNIVNRRPEKHIWLAAFMVVGALTSWSGYKASVALEREIRGADLCYFMISTIVDAPDGEIRLMVLNPNDVPVYDVYVNIRSHVGVTWDTPEHADESIHHMRNPQQLTIGNVPPGLKMLSFSLPFGYYQIDIRTRYAKYTEMLKFGPFEGKVGFSYVVADYHGHTFTKSTVPSNFPGTY